MEPELAAILDTLALAVAEDHLRALDAMMVLAKAGPGRIYAACCVWSEAMVGLSLDPAAAAMHPASDAEQRRRNWGMGILDETGEQLDPEDVGAPEMVWAMRFITAQANRDATMTVALFEALPPGEAAAYVWSLLSMVAAALRED